MPACGTKRDTDPQPRARLFIELKNSAERPAMGPLVDFRRPAGWLARPIANPDAVFRLFAGERPGGLRPAALGLPNLFRRPDPGGHHSGLAVSKRVVLVESRASRAFRA